MKDSTMYSIKYLIENSKLPGPRGNLKLLYEFSKNAEEEEIDECIEFIKPDVKNSPEEFVGMCGILSYSIKNQDNLKKVFQFLKENANHGSWRIRESVAMSIQEISKNKMTDVLNELKSFIKGSELEKRAVVAGLCEPKLLTNKELNLAVLDILLEISKQFIGNEKLNDESTSLKKALGYGWSVVIAATPDEGRIIFEKLFELQGKHITWIIKENLKKSRLRKMDDEWVNSCLAKTK